jgi:hypothetical protein
LPAGSFCLDAVGYEIWNLLSGGNSIRAASREIAPEIGVAVREVANDANGLIGQLLAQGVKTARELLRRCAARRKSGRASEEVVSVRRHQIRGPEMKRRAQVKVSPEQQTAFHREVCKAPVGIGLVTVTLVECERNSSLDGDGTAL